MAYGVHIIMPTRLRITRHLVLAISRLEFVRLAMAEKADLSAFKEKPSLEVVAGVSLIGLSFLLGWPSVAGLGVLAVHLNKPLIALIGGPLIYGFSHLVFLAGMYFSGSRYSLIFCRWLARVSMEKALVKVGAGESDSPSYRG